MYPNVNEISIEFYLSLEIVLWEVYSTAAAECNGCIFMIPAMLNVHQVWDDNVEERMYTRCFKPSEDSFSVSLE